MASRKGPKSEGERQRDRVRYLEYSRGIRHLADPAPAMRRITIWRQKGIDLDTITERTGVSKAQIRHIQNGVRTEIRTSTLEKIMGARFTPADIAKFPAVGVRRRLRALAAIGFSSLTLGEILARDRKYVNAIMTGKNAREFVLRPIGLAVHEAYEKYRDVDPMTMGQTSFATNYAKSTAIKNSWGAPKDWDDDTIDDPEAWPEFTGECGRVRGIMIHLRDGIPFCERCFYIIHNSPGRSVDPVRIFDMHSEGATTQEIADHFGVRKDLITQYVNVLNVVQQHRLTSVDTVNMRGLCERCGVVGIRSSGLRKDGSTKLICANSVDSGHDKRRKNAARATGS